MAHKTVRQRLQDHVDEALGALYADGYLTGDRPTIPLAPPKQAGHGDFASAAALALAKPAKKNPREIATKFQEALGNAGGMLEKTEIAGPGFLNLFVAPATWHAELATILDSGADYLSSDAGAGEKILLEYVSANPTGPLHIAHGRGAVHGDVLARLFKAAGYGVHREYYVNDLGNQTDVMARSVYLRYGELHGQAFDPPEDFYPDESITDVARTIKDSEGDKYLEKPEEQWLDHFRSVGIKTMLDRIKSDLSSFGIGFDAYVSERELTESIGLEGLVERLEKAGHVYEKEGRKWFKTTDFGDDKDRVVVREDGRTTYFTSDIAYHDQKLERGYDKLINVWGADHGGYVARVKAGLEALGYDPNRLEIQFVQIVSLTRDGEPVRMGKRLGTAVWLKDVLDEVGKDAARYFFVTRRCDAQMELDVGLLTRKSLDNPVFYAQMGHARMCSIARRAKEAGIEEPSYEAGTLDALALPEELGMIRTMAAAPEMIVHAAQEREPHQVVHFIQDLIAQFHSYFTKYKATERVISDDAAKTTARLLLCAGMRTILASLLDIVGVDAPEEMYLDDPNEAEESTE